MADWQDKFKSTTSKFASTISFPKLLKSQPTIPQNRPRPSFSVSAPPTPPKSPDEELPRLSFSLGCRRSATEPATLLTPRAEDYGSYPLHPPSNSSSSSNSTAFSSAFSSAYSSFPTTPLAELNSPTFDSSSTESVDTPAPDQAIGQLYVNIIQARGLKVSNPSRFRPYCLVEFEKNQLTTPVAVPQEDVPNAIPIPGARPRNGPLGGGGTRRRDRDILEAAAKEAASPNWRHEATFDVTRRDGEITLSVYDRGVSTVSSEETFLGMVTIRPNLVHKLPVDSWLRLRDRTDAESESDSEPDRASNSAVMGEVHVQIIYTALENRKRLRPSDFRMERLVGRGSFGKVFQVKKIDTGRTYAMKVLNKRDLVERREVTHTLSERNVLIKAQASPFIVSLKFSFQTPEQLYLVMDFVSGGELFWHLQREKMFSEERARFYCAELVLALEHLHKFDVVYRDLKPENILLDSTGHVALTDFGLCKEHVGPGEVATTFCGTSEYLAPEVLMSKGHNRAVDWWSLGILLHECMTGWPPFYSEDITELYESILSAKIRFPPSMSHDARDLISALLERDPAKRLGAVNDAQDVKKHLFFASIDWDKLAKKQLRPPFKPPSAAEIAAVGRVGGVGIDDWDGVIGSEGMIVGSNMSQRWRAKQQAELEVGGVGSLGGTWQKQFSGFSYSPGHASLMSRRTVGSMASVDSWVE